MKNRIFWVIENDRAIPEATLAEEQNPWREGQTPWAIFGALGHSERQTMQSIYDAGKLAVPLNQFAALARFRRLVADLEEADIYGDTSP